MTVTTTPITPTASDAVAKKLTFEEYRFYQDGTDTIYELLRGQLISMPTASALHTEICKFLVYKLQKHFAAFAMDLIAVHNVGVRTEIDSSRVPDVLICTPQLWEQAKLRKGAGILDLEEVPILVVEVTSENWQDDYIHKRAEYEVIKIPEYWIADAKKQRLRMLFHTESGYEEIDLKPGDKICSRQFPQLMLTVDEILSPPIVEDLIKAEQAHLLYLEQQLNEEKQRAEAEKQRAERLAALLLERGIDPNELL